MHFRVLLESNIDKNRIPINYQYPLSAAIYKIIKKGDANYAEFLHHEGYGKGFKFFTFSRLNCPFYRDGDRLILQSKEMSFYISFHIPLAMENFISGLFRSETIVIADNKSRAIFSVKTIETLTDPLAQYAANQVIQKKLKPLSQVVAGIPDEKGNYNFLSPEDQQFPISLIYNWRNKIETFFDRETAENAVLLLEVVPTQYELKSRLISIKGDTGAETKIRGWINFLINATAERRFIELLYNAGAGIYNSMGCGCMEVVTSK